MADPMGGTTSRTRESVGQGRRELAERLRESTPELEETIFDQIYAAERAGSQGSPSMRGVRSVVQSALEHGIDSVELGHQHFLEPPPAVVDHARKAAWRSVPLQTLYDRYLTGYSVFKHFLLREATGIEVAREVQGPLDIAYQRLLHAIAEEHRRQHQKRNRSSDLRRLERVEELLSGTLLEAPDLQYPLGGTHVGIVASGPEVSSTIRQLFQPLGSNLLLVTPAPGTIWIWAKIAAGLRSADIDGMVPLDLPPEVCISIGEPAEGLTGWRRTHRQAKAAFRIALRREGRSLYRDVATLASLAEDDLLMASLEEGYLVPLKTARDDGELLRQTLRTYFRVNRNGASAAAALSVSRQTVNNRLRTVEDRLNRPLSECADALDAALQLEALGFITP